ncbi:hypothetical protein V5N11_006978 [Cardamine amara subsp. amara]|uniref:Uncharacterized protein n=1 Tax=Cardamine amara subsp. amara TaxID=228776 RepID=A0ABD1AVA6_CARAN
MKLDRDLKLGFDGDMEGMVNEEEGKTLGCEDDTTDLKRGYDGLLEVIRKYGLDKKPKEIVRDSGGDDQSSTDDGSDCVESLPDFDLVEKMNPSQWQIDYHFTLCSRLGLFCYNFQKGTDYNFEFLHKTYTNSEEVSILKFLIITEASMSPSDSSPLRFETLIYFPDGRIEGGGLWWETTVCRVKGSKEADHEWDNEAIHEWYKGELPKWLSDDDNHQHCYVVQESELLDNDNWWLHLFSEFAFYTKWYENLGPSEVADSLPLVTQKVIVETRGEAEREPREKLKAANAVFYISFVCGDDPLTREVTSYRAVVRKTMDGKPGHMRLEVNCWEHLTDPRR